MGCAGNSCSRASPGMRGAGRCAGCTSSGRHRRRASSCAACAVALHDVLLDLRPAEPTFMRHVSAQLDQDNRDAVYVPPGVAHGFQTLADGTEVLYQMTDFHAPDLAAGCAGTIRRSRSAGRSPQPSVIAARDAGYPDFDADAFAAELARHRTAGAATREPASAPAGMPGAAAARVCRRASTRSAAASRGRASARPCG